MEPFDNGWKYIIQQHLYDFLSFYFPQVHTMLDASAKPRFLDKELQRLTRRLKTGKRYADLLVQVQLKTGEPGILFCHIEVQQSPEKNLTWRLFQYSYRIFDRLGFYPITLALLTDSVPGFRPEGLTIEAAGLPVVRFQFYIAKLLDFRDRISNAYSGGATASDRANPFALATRIHLEYMAARKKNKRRLTRLEDANQSLLYLKLELTRQLKTHGHSSLQIQSLFMFLDWIILLPEGLDEVYYKESRKVLEDSAMGFISTPERIGLRRGLKEGMERGIEKGIEKGITQGQRAAEQAILIRLLEHKFSLSEEEKAFIRSVENTQALERALDSIIDATDKAQVLGVLESPGQNRQE